jgi:uncharacterized membrane protein
MKEKEERLRVWASYAVTLILSLGFPLVVLGVVVAAMAILAGIIRLSLTWGG